MLTNNICNHAMQNKICLHLTGVSLDPSSRTEYMLIIKIFFFLKVVIISTKGQRKFVGHIQVLRVLDLAMVVYSN